MAFYKGEVKISRQSQASSLYKKKKKQPPQTKPSDEANNLRDLSSLQRIGILTMACQQKKHIWGQRPMKVGLPDVPV